MALSIFMVAALMCLVQVAPVVQSATPTTLFFKDAAGRSLLFHGVNAVYKEHPWIPGDSAFSPADSLNSLDIDHLHQWGFNVVRLGVMWPGVSPDGISVNHTYISRVKKLIADLHARGISTIVDMHQDVLSRKYCGEGIPDALVHPTKDPLLQFPMPVHLPYPVDANEYPSLQTCLQKVFAEYNLSFEVARLFGEVYNSSSTVNAALLKFWDVVSASLSRSPGVLGYELINEPSPGNFFRHPSLAVPGVADREMLVPLYRQLERVIRRNDARTPIFFEPVVSDVWTSGFNSSNMPNSSGGPVCYSYHVYCGSVNRTDDDPSNTGLCEFEQGASWALRMQDLQRLGVPGFMTEFGAWSGHPRAVEILEWQLNLADQYLQSTAYWQFKYFHDLTTVAGPDEGFYTAEGELQTAKVKALSRTYAYATQGEPLRMVFDSATGIFFYSFKSDTDIKEPTLLYLNELFYYPRGFKVTISPAGAASWKRVGKANRISVLASRNNTIVNINIIQS